MSGAWAVVKAEPSHDRLAVTGVTLLGFETFWPRTRVRVGAQYRTLPLFPGYFFARIDGTWMPIARTIGVHGLIMSGAAPARCPDEEIRRLLEMADRDGVVRLGPRPNGAPRPAFAPGDQVRIVDGAFRGFGALYLGQTSSDRLLVLMTVMGGERQVALGAGMVAARQ
jgi:transcriptional antiterminator RfaH